MPRLTLNEQTQMARLMLDRSRRAAVAKANQSAFLRWRYGAPVADNLLIVPQELRSADPSFASEIEFGHFGLSGTVAIVEDESPFSIVAPSLCWTRALHGFGWLRHLRAAGNERARDAALGLTADWIKLHGNRQGVAWEAAVTGRRLMSWVVNAPLLLDDVDPDAFDATTDSLGGQLIHLSATWPEAPDGVPRLLALTGLLMGSICIAGHERHLGEVEANFIAELNRQILPDGGHISRNPEVPVELLLDFLPLRQCFGARSRAVPADFDAAIARLLRMVRFMRLGDGRLARFNGMSAHSIDALSAVLAYDSAPEDRMPEAGSSAYVRFERGTMIVIVDAGSPPPLEFAGSAHAGCLSFELSVGGQAVFVNGGAPTNAARDWLASARATASHNTLCLGGKSSSKLVRHPALEQLIGAAPIRFPNGVSHKLVEADGGVAIDLYHDGYVHRFKLLHRRRLVLNASGTRLTGEERLGPQRGQLRLAQDLPFAVHFHLDSSVICRLDRHEAAAILTLSDGQTWRFSGHGAALSLEDSVHYAEPTGPVRARQLVLRGSTYGETEVNWCFVRLDAVVGDRGGEAEPLAVETPTIDDPSNEKPKETIAND